MAEPTADLLAVPIPANGRITPERSRILTEIRRRKKAEREAQAVADAQAKLIADREREERPPEPPKLSPERVLELEIVNEQITRLRDDLKQDMEPKDRAALTRALNDMLERARIIRGEPSPGSLRPTKDTRPSSILSAPAITPAKTRVDQE